MNKVLLYFSPRKMQHILFLDIETVPIERSYNDLGDRMQAMWDLKAARIAKDDLPADVYQRAGIYAEFGKIVCISAGIIYEEAGEERLRITSFIGDEVEILESFFEKLRAFFKGKPKQFCGHNIKEFDIPYICRRALIKGIKMPTVLAELQTKKPWEIPLLDTLQMWKFGDYKHYTSLDLIAAVLGIETPKSDISGGDVARVFYEENNIERIKTYCEKDVLTTAQVFRKLNQKEMLPSSAVEFI